MRLVKIQGEGTAPASNIYECSENIIVRVKVT